MSLFSSSSSLCIYLALLLLVCVVGMFCYYVHSTIERHRRIISAMTDLQDTMIYDLDYVKRHIGIGKMPINPTFYNENVKTLAVNKIVQPNDTLIDVSDTENNSTVSFTEDELSCDDEDEGEDEDEDELDDESNVESDADESDAESESESDNEYACDDIKVIKLNVDEYEPELNKICENDDCDIDLSETYDVSSFTPINCVYLVTSEEEFGEDSTEDLKKELKDDFKTEVEEDVKEKELKDDLKDDVKEEDVKEKELKEEVSILPSASELKSISCDEIHNLEETVDYKKLQLQKLRSIVIEKGLANNHDANKLKKHELLKLLGDEQ